MNEEDPEGDEDVVDPFFLCGRGVRESEEEEEGGLTIKPKGGDRTGTQTSSAGDSATKLRSSLKKGRDCKGAGASLETTWIFLYQRNGNKKQTNKPTINPIERKHFAQR